MLQTVHELDVDKKIPPVPNQRALLSFNEILVLAVLRDAHKAEMPLSGWEIKTQVADYKSKGRQEVQVERYIQSFLVKGAIRIHGSEKATGKTNRYEITPKGQWILEQAVKIWTTLFC